MALVVGAYLWAPRMALDLVTFKPFHGWINYGGSRGMSPWRDTVDWVGGYPFEVARPEEIFQFYRDRGFTLRTLVTAGGTLGNNEFVFELAGGSGA
jgi:2-polyprenyl-6-hydroxyphenyl methylase/3-demethylubiquinone-9 3-methyltransferase